MSARGTKTVLVAGASGDVGAEVLAALAALDRSVRVRALVRSTPLRAGGSGTRVEPVAGDFADRDSLVRALTGVDAAFFVSPHCARERELGAQFIAACEAAGVRRLVFSGAIRPLAGNALLQRALDELTVAIGPHYRPKLRVEQRARRSGLETVVLMPSNFYQNDALALPEILAGSYPQPLGTRGANRVDCRDIGAAAARALLDGALQPGLYPLVGPDSWTGPACAVEWSAALARPVRYAGDDVAAWSATVGARMPAAKRDDFARTYRVLQRFGYRAPAAVLERTCALLGRAPLSYGRYVRDLAATALSAARDSAGAPGCGATNAAPVAASG